MTPTPARSQTATRSSFFVVIAGVIAAAVAFGFGRTYAAPIVRGTFAAPWVVHLHGALAGAWVMLFLAQPLLVRLGHVSWHRRLGQVGLPLACAVALTMLPAGVYAVTRDAAAGGGDTAISTIVGVVTSAILFVALVSAGILARRRREAHGRWMLLATLATSLRSTRSVAAHPGLGHAADGSPAK